MKAFVAVADAGSFTAASDRMHISKKLVSKYVGLLEQDLDVRLFHRTTRRLSLTSAGQQYYPNCVRILEEIEKSESALQQAEAALSGAIRMTAPLGFGVLRIQDLLCQFRALHPEVTFDLHLSDAYTNIAEEGFDLAIRIGALDDSSLIAKRLTRTEFWAVASPDYLSRAPRLSHPSDLAGHDCIIDTNFRAGSHWRFVTGQETEKFAISGAFRVNSAEAARNLARAHQGIALLPDYIAAQDVASGKLAHVLADFPTRFADVNAVFLDRRHLPVRVRSLIDFLQAAFAQSTS